MSMPIKFIAASCLASVAALPLHLHAQSWPSRPLRIISGFAPGGATDITERAAAQKLSESLGQTVVVENRPGAAGNVAAEMVARGTPDGYSFQFLVRAGDVGGHAARHRVTAEWRHDESAGDE
jgi:tripartite-type tricarboxylate transporter receptor subunit TctC